MRESLLGRDPEIESVSMAALVSIATRIERESLQRYTTLAATMERRGEVATAAAFRVMADEERKHADAVDHWAAAVGEPLSAAGKFEWRLPPDLAAAWDDIAGSARLTPYRAFAIAVDNERRAFTLYSYLAARATDARVAREAEKLAIEELRHAALMRRWRRQAWHRERRAAQEEQQPVIASIGALHEFLARREAKIAACHRALATRLRECGDDDSAQRLEELLQMPSRTPAATSEVPRQAAPADADSVHLLVAAQEPLEALSEALEGLLRVTEGELFAEVEKALANVVTRLARIALQTSRRMQAA